MAEVEEEVAGRRWLIRVKTTADALQAIRIAAYTFYAVAAFQGLLIGTLMVVNTFWTANIFDPLLMFYLAVCLHKRQSRTAASALLVYALASAALAFGVQFGLLTPAAGSGRSSLLALIALYAIYYGMAGTWKFHALAGHRVHWPRTANLIGVIVVYMAVAAAIMYAMLGLAVPVAIWDDPQWETLRTLLLVVPPGLMALLGGWRLLPGTGGLATLEGRDDEAPPLPDGSSEAGPEDGGAAASPVANEVPADDGDEETK